MFGYKLCSHCKTGKYTYDLDGRSAERPYLGCFNGKKCAMYKRLDKPEKRSFRWNRLKRIFISSVE